MENIFQIMYNEKLDRLEMPKDTILQKIERKIAKHKFISLAIGMFLVLSSINFYLIYSFMKILENSFL